MSSSTLVANTLLSSISGGNVDLNLLVSGSGAIIANTAQIKDVVDPTDDQDAVTKIYVDQQVTNAAPKAVAVDFAGVLINENAPQAVLDQVTSELVGRADPLEFADVKFILENSRGYSEPEAQVEAQTIIDSFPGSNISKIDWGTRYNQLRSVDQNALLFKGSVLGGTSLEPQLFFSTENNDVESYSPVTNELTVVLGENFILALPPGGTSYFTDGTKFIRSGPAGIFVTVAPKDLSVSGYVSETKVATNDTTDVVIAQIPVIANPDELIEFKVMSHLINVNALRWSIDFILKYDAGTTSVGAVSVQDNFGSPQPILLQFAEAGGIITIEARARVGSNADFDASQFVTKVNVNNVILPVP